MTPSLFFAALSIGGDDLAGMFAILMVFGIPILAILTKHQRKMAEIIHQGGGLNQTSALETQALRAEIHELKSLMHQQAILIDQLATKQTEALSQRIQV